MLTNALRRKGWCPGALRPMPAKDGLIVRLRISGGLSAAALRQIAAACRADGNGLLDLSSRGNLQLRGVSEAGFPRLLASLGALGLIDDDAGAEAVRNVLASPLAGLAADIDVRPIAGALEAALASARDLHRLPGKFGFLIDDGGPLSLAAEPADVRFDYCRTRKTFAVSIGGTALGAASLGCCVAEEVVDTALAIARAFLALGSAMTQPPRRMAALIAGSGVATIAAAAGLRPGPAPPTLALELPKTPSPIGFMTFGDAGCFGAAAAFGRLTAAMLDAAADAAQTFGSGEIRLTPWRALILPSVDPGAGAALGRRLAAEGFIVARADPRLAVAACGGGAACAEASTPTHADALALAVIGRRFIGEGIALHVSGCAKGCARPRATPLTLVGNCGRYDLVLDGRPGDAAAARNLTLPEAQAMLAAMAPAGAEAENGSRL